MEREWELFYVPFMSVISVAFIVTTRSDAVANNMRATSIFPLGCLSEEDSWSLFHHYAFFGTNSNADPNMLNIGRQITKKCGGLPLVVKSISNLLRFEGEKSWINILQNDMWGDNDDDKIYRVLQISYTHMPAYLRPCFLYCSLFPKNYVYFVNEVIELWIAQGYIEFNKEKSLEEIAFAYSHELKERSFFDNYDVNDKRGTLWSTFKMHDIIHDLARRNSGFEFYSVERGKLPNLYDGILHFYMDGYEAISNHLTSESITNLRTIVIQHPSNCVDISDAKSLRTIKLYNTRKEWYEGLLLNFAFPKHLRFLEINCGFKGPLSDSVFSLYHLEKLNLDLKNDPMELEALRNLINLQYLSLSQCNVQNLLGSLCLLKNLRMLSLSYCESVGLPENVGDLAHLEKLVFDTCGSSETLNMLPESFCKLPNLKTLSLIRCRIERVAKGLWKLNQPPKLDHKGCSN
ncbi:hypothetical protein LUZ60_002430 [Juncus effusus]|nr:hypothetical protein LUZ60_002430 [Juncus effusus]